MNGKDLFLGMNHISARFIEEAETATGLKERRGHLPLRKILVIAAAVALLALTVTACAYAIRRIRMDLVQHDLPVRTEPAVTGTEAVEEDRVPDILTECYPQALPEGYAILCGSPADHHSRNIHYRSDAGKNITFWISAKENTEGIALRPPVTESTLTLTAGEGILNENEGAQVLQWQDEKTGYYATLFTDDVTVDLVAMADSVGFGNPIPLSVWYHRGQVWDPWYPQTLPQGYTCTDVAPVSGGCQSMQFTNGENTIRFRISTVEDLTPADTGEDHWEETEVNGAPAKLRRTQSNQRLLYWENTAAGFWAFLETEDGSVDLESLAESVGPGTKLKISASWLGPDYTIELEQEPTAYIAYQSIYPQQLPAGYVLEFVGDRAYGQQTLEWKNDAGETVTYTFYFRLGPYGREFEGSGQPETVSVQGHTGYLTGNTLLWADEKQGFAYKLSASGDVDLVALANSVGPGPELPVTNDGTAKALAQLGDYRITQLPEHMIEDGLSGSPLEGEDDWYSYVRRWYYDTTDNDQVFFTYETYLTDRETEEEVLRLFISVSQGKEVQSVTVQGCPGITAREGNGAKVVWIMGDATRGISFQLYSEQFTAEQLLEMAQSVQKTE